MPCSIPFYTRPADTMHSIRAIFHALIDFFFPLTSEERRVAAMTATDFMQCAARRHAHVVRKKPYTLSPFVYRDALVRTAIHVGKYRGKKSVCHMLGAVMWDIYGEDVAVHTLMCGMPWFVVPVPMSPRKKRKRGYNHAGEIAHSFVSHASADVCMYAPHCVGRVTHRESQTLTRSRSERQKNAHNVFVVTDTEAVRDKNILVIDDVTTSGATMSDMARALRAAGARRILCIAVAH